MPRVGSSMMGGTAPGRVGRAKPTPPGPGAVASPGKPISPPPIPGGSSGDDGPTGSVLPTVIRLAGDSTGALAPFLEMTVEAGSGGGFQDCGGFVSERVVYEGTLADFAAGPAEGVEVFTASESPESHTFRLSFVLSEGDYEDDPEATADFVWETRGRS